MIELSLHILDICQNSIKADATLIEIIVEEHPEHNQFRIVIRDNGCGMSKETLSQVADPFFTTRTTRKVGLGLSLFQLAAEQCGGTLSIQSEEGHGTSVVATFEHNHIDRAPLGRIEDTLLILILNEAEIDIRYTHIYNAEEYVFDTRDIREVLGDVPLNDPDIFQWIKEHIKQGTTTIHKEETT
jgi:anti-sigma regulatory factor (Ser/Thr protein kinase)